MQARVVVVGAVRGVEELTYAVPPVLEGSLQPGHRVLAPLRSRKVTAVVLETGTSLAGSNSGTANPGSNGKLKPILELLEPRPLFDRAHLQMMEFLANYYMIRLAEVYRSVIPAVARVESRIVYRLARSADALRTAAFSEAERLIVGALEKRPLTARQIARLATNQPIAATLGRLAAEGIVASGNSTRGRHREPAGLVARIIADATVGSLRGKKQRELVQIISDAGGSIAIAELGRELAGSRIALKVLERRGMIRLEPAKPEPIQVGSMLLNSLAAVSHNGDALFAQTHELTIEQKTAIDAITPAIENKIFATFLLYGVTGSGKTEVYMQLAARALKAGRSVIVLVPEIALADEVVRSFREHFGALVGIAHSAQNISERWASWTAALSGEARIMIGPRSLIFAPLHDTGLIIVDEEHDPAYKNEEGIRYHARDLAVVLGRFAHCPVVLGSATPSAESFANARRGRYRLLRLPRRVNDRAMASVEIVDLRQEAVKRHEISKNQEAAARQKTGHARGGSAQAPSDGNAGRARPDLVPISEPLALALRKNLATGGQSLIFLNRRGYHNFLQCHLCGNVIACSNCSVGMTFHLRDRSIRCHYCGNRIGAPEQCPECGGLELQGQGFGTERLQSAIAELLPGARIERMDSDTSGRRGARTGILTALRAGEIDVLVGTQMITKGFDFPGVTLAAVIMADASLNLPDFRSAERTFQLLTQVAGRAGRGERPGQVIIQTYAPHHYSIRAARDQDFQRFIRRELELRRELSYPPFAKLAMVRVEGRDSARVSRIAASVAEVLERAADAYRRTASPDIIRVLGPAPAPIERIKNRYRWQVMVKSDNFTALRTAVAAMQSALANRARENQVYLAVDMDPVRML